MSSVPITKKMLAMTYLLHLFQGQIVTYNSEFTKTNLQKLKGSGFRGVVYGGARGKDKEYSHETVLCVIHTLSMTIKHCHN